MTSAKYMVTALMVVGLAVTAPVAYQAQARAVQTAALAATPTTGNRTQTATQASAATDYQARVVLALHHCRSGAAARTYPTMTACVGDLAGPTPGDRQQADIWNTFLDCLSAWYKALDAMYPNPGADVNNCLERNGWDVQP